MNQTSQSYKQLCQRFPDEAGLVSQLNQASKQAGVKLCFMVQENSGGGAIITVKTDAAEQVQQLIKAISLA